jgi:hypothetical protein
VPQVALGQDLLDGKRGGQQVERGESLPGERDLTRLLVAGAQLDGEVRTKLVGDHQS